MSKNVFYADLDMINGKGVLITGHGKGLVAKNPIINGNYIANDMVRLLVRDADLFGYQGYVEKEDNDLTKIEYLLYFFEQSEPNQPSEPEQIKVDKYLSLSKHNIDTGERMAKMTQFMFMLSSTTKDSVTAFSEYQTILKQATNVNFIAIPYTDNENERATFVNELIK